MKKRRYVLFTGPRRLEIQEAAIPCPDRSLNEFLVRTLATGISAGTELRFYRGNFSQGVLLDEQILALRQPFQYPTTYGYSNVGEVEADGRRVFSFRPHESHYVASDESLFAVPEDVSVEGAVLWPSFETAVNLILDARPLIGEKVLVVGQGIIGLAVTALLSEYPLQQLCTIDKLAKRREASVRIGADYSFTPEEAMDSSFDVKDFDLAIELSGHAEGLNLATNGVGFEGRVVVGSWYGEKPQMVELGTHFHRGRLQLISSQVSHINPCFTKRWDRARRMETAARALARFPVETLISHRFPVERAGQAYSLLDREPENCLQVLLTYT